MFCVAPDPTLVMRFQVHQHGTVASTSETAFEALREHTARHGDVHVAQAQTRGRGRLGRSWHSDSGLGLYMSVVLLPERVLSPAGLTMAAGLAVRDAVLALGLSSARLKWPNDVVVPTAAGEAKLAGILVETRGLDPEHPHYVVGIGVNVAQVSFPSELVAERPVASLRTCGITTDVGGVLAELLPPLARRLDQITLDPTRLARDFVESLGLSAERVLLVQGEVAILGRLVSFDVDAGVVIAADDGRQHVVPLEIVRELRSAR